MTSDSVLLWNDIHYIVCITLDERLVYDSDVNKAWILKANKSQGLDPEGQGQGWTLHGLQGQGLDSQGQDQGQNHD